MELQRTGPGVEESAFGTEHPQVSREPGETGRGYMTGKVGRLCGQITSANYLTN